MRAQVVSQNARFKSAIALRQKKRTEVALDNLARGTLAARHAGSAHERAVLFARGAVLQRAPWNGIGARRLVSRARAVELAAVRRTHAATNALHLDGLQARHPESAILQMRARARAPTANGGSAHLFVHHAARARVAIVVGVDRQRGERLGFCVRCRGVGPRGNAPTRET